MQSAMGSESGTTQFDDLSLPELHRRSSYKWRTYAPDVLPLSVAEMDFPVWAGLRDVLRDAIDRSDLGYPPAEDSLGFGPAVASWLGRAFGMAVDPSMVIALPDVVRGLDTSVIAFARRGRGVIVTPPIYPPFLQSAANHERHRVDAPLLRDADGTWHLDLAGIDRELGDGADMVLFCHPHNPTGRAFPSDELAGLIDIALRRGAVVVSDEVHAPLTLAGHVHTPLLHHHPGAAEAVVTLTSASKAWNMAGLKCGIAVFHSDRTLDRFLAVPRRTRTGVGLLGMLATLAVLERGQSWLDAVVDYLTATSAWLATAVEEHLPGVAYHPPEASYLAWLDFTATPIASDPAGALLRGARVALEAGDDFGPGGAGFARLNFGTSRSILEEALRAMAPVVRGTA